MSEDWTGWGSPLADISDDPNPTKYGPACLDVANIGYGIGYLDREDGCALVAKAIHDFENAEAEPDTINVHQLDQRVFSGKMLGRPGSVREMFFDSFVRVL